MSRRCASCPQALSHTSVPSPRPLSSTQLVIHLSRPCLAVAPRSAAAPQPCSAGGELSAPVPHKPQRQFSPSQPLLPMPLTLTCAQPAASPPTRPAGGAAARRGAPMHCTSCRISSLGYTGEPCLICCNVPYATGGLRSFLPVMASS